MYWLDWFWCHFSNCIFLFMWFGLGVSSLWERILAIIVWFHEQLHIFFIVFETTDFGEEEFKVIIKLYILGYGQVIGYTFYNCGRDMGMEKASKIQEIVSLKQNYVGILDFPQIGNSDLQKTVLKKYRFPKNQLLSFIIETS